MACEPNVQSPGTVLRIPRKHPRWKRLLFVTAITFGILMIGELAARVAIHSSSPFTVSQIISLRHETGIEEVPSISEVVHPYLGWVLDPDSHPGQRTSHGPMRVNDFGLLDNDSPIRRRSPDKLIVGVVGGSVAWYVSAEGGPSLLRELEASERFHGRRIELVRLAMHGYKQPQQLMLMTYLLTLGAEFDLLINIDGYNEVALHEAENEQSQVFPPFPRAWYTRVNFASDPRCTEAALQTIATRRAKRIWAQRMSHWPFQKSALLNFVWWSMDRQYDAKIRDLNGQILEQNTQHSGYSVRGPHATFTDTTDLHRYLVEYWATCSSELHHLCESHGIEYHHILPPNQYLAGSKPLLESEREHPYFAEKHRYTISAQACYPLLVERGKRLLEQGIRFHDLTMLFAGIYEPLYGDTRCHYNERGNALVAESIGQTISRSPNMR